ncbi:MAG: penicillin acylase family protein [Rhodobiaceae bacterium]|nr:penicillin acylase family protein [Rhodobiaceae bacterium]
MSTVLKIGKWTGYVLLALIILIGLLLMDRYGAARQSVDAHEGSFQLAGLTAPIEIIRDENSVPHIFGSTEEDVAFGLGVTHAQDRLWQMELFRRAGQGRLAELLGSFALPADRYLRTLDLYGQAQATVPELAPETQALLEAYAAGVNSYLAQREIPLPPEFLFMAHSPEPWVAADSVVMIKLLALGLSGNATRELSRARLAEVLTADQLAAFFPPYPGDGPVALPDLASLYADTPIREAAASIPDIGPKGASNNWVVDGRHTASGKPLLANDPHLGMLAPSIWYLAHLAYPDRNVVGGTIAGVPSVVLGRNDHIAWGYTNTGPDTQDLYVEKLNPDNPEEYLTPDGYQTFDVRTETIKVRFGADETFTIRSTRNGPVLPSDFFGADELIEEGHVLSLSWTAFASPDLTIEAGHNITKAKNFEEFRDALRSYVAPMQNMVFANVDGEIGFIAPARIPVRNDAHETLGLIPAPGWKEENSWTGVIPFDGLPQTYNPASGKIVTANNKIVSDSYPYSITKQWDLPYRAERIEELLAESTAHTVESFNEMLMDNGSSFAAKFAPLLLSMAADTPETTTARERLAAWNHRMDGNQAEPILFLSWMRELTRLVYADELQEEFSSRWRFHPVFMEQVLKGIEGKEGWCDNTTSMETSETCADLVDEALTKAIADAQERFGDDMDAWRWDEAHPVVNRHIPGSFLPLLGEALTIARPSSGGNHTINRGQHSIGSSNPFDNIHAAGYRAVYDLANLNASRYMISTGQSGNPFSPDFDHLATNWAEGGSITIETDRTSIDAKSQMSLTPAR